MNMDAVSFIQQNLDVDKLLQHYDFDMINSSGEIIRACCKLHGGNNPTAFVINRETGLWYCHTGGCGGGDAFTLVQKMESIDFHAAVQFLADLFNMDIRNLRITKHRDRHTKELKRFIEAMKAKHNVELPQFALTDEVQEVVKYRGFQEETLRHFQVGYAKKVTLHKRSGDKYTLYNRLVFPIIFDDVQIGVSLRRTKATDYPKWSHQPAHIEVKSILYNYDNCKDKSLIAVCEGIHDVLAFHEINVPCVALFGSHITAKQYRLLLKTGADLAFAFDGDEAGETLLERAAKMFKYKANIFALHFEAGEDPESITREELMKRYENRKRMC